MLKKTKKILWDYPKFLFTMSRAYFSVDDMAFIAVEYRYLSSTITHIFKEESNRLAKEKRDEMHIT